MEESGSARECPRPSWGSHSLEENVSCRRTEDGCHLGFGVAVPLTVWREVRLGPDPRGQPAALFSPLPSQVLPTLQAQSKPYLPPRGAFSLGLFTHISSISFFSLGVQSYALGAMGPGIPFQLCHQFAVELTQVTEPC